MMHWSRQLCGELRVDFMSVGRLCYQDGHWYYRRRLVGLYQEIRLILLCLYTSYSLLRLHTLYLDLLTCTFLPLQETIMLHTNILYYSLYLDLLTSAALEGDYVTPMNNTHLLC